MRAHNCTGFAQVSSHVSTTLRSRCMQSRCSRSTGGLTPNTTPTAHRESGQCSEWCNGAAARNPKKITGQRRGTTNFANVGIMQRCRAAKSRGRRLGRQFLTACCMLVTLAQPRSIEGHTKERTPYFPMLSVGNPIGCSAKFAYFLD